MLTSCDTEVSVGRHFKDYGTEQHTLTGELKEPAGNKKSHLPSTGGRCNRGGRVRAQAPGETQQKMEKGKRETKKEGERVETGKKKILMITRKELQKTSEKETLKHRKQQFSVSAPVNNAILFYCTLKKGN